jgi:hypothetical protein
MQRTKRVAKVRLAILCGFAVAIISTAVHIATLPPDRAILLHAGIGDFIAGLTAVIVSLAIQLRQEEVHYRTAMERAAIVAELNHHVRNAVFPLCLVIQKLGDAEAMKTANESVERINIALKDATVDALSGRTDYQPSDSEPTVMSSL